VALLGFCSNSIAEHGKILKNDTKVGITQTFPLTILKIMHNQMTK
jgi:transcriptional regulator of met regulon